jgi:adenylate cyclase
MFAKEKIIVRLNQLFRNLLFHLVFWYLSLLLFVFLTGHEQLFSKYVELLNVKSVFFTNLFVAAIIAIFFTVLDGLFNDRLLRYSSTKIMMVVLPLLYLIIGTLLITLAPLSPKIILGLNNLDDFFKIIPDFNIYLIRFLVFFYLACFFNKLIQRMIKSVGKGNFGTWFFGMMNKPREDERIFMFIDMKSSTSIAEKLAHKKFSLLVQDVFNDLAIVDNYMGEIYQYMGDGAIISWSLKKGLKDNNFLKAYFRFINLIKKRENYYFRKYDLLPKFKAGVHVGKVMVLQVGRIRKDISFNGDTLNTAARIESMCNDFNKSLLISGDLHDMLENKEEFFSKEVGNLRLKGKRRKVDIYHIRPRKKYAKETSPYLRLLLDKLNIFKRRVVIEDRTKLTDSEFGHKQLKKIDDDQASEITKKAS